MRCTTSSPLVGFFLVIALVGAAGGAVDAQAPSPGANGQLVFDPINPTGTVVKKQKSDSMPLYYGLIAPGPYLAQLEVVNQCDWPQAVTFTFDRTGAGGSGPVRTIPAHGSVVVGFPVTRGTYANGTPADNELVVLKFIHDESVMGNKKCLARTAYFNFTVFWAVKPDQAFTGFLDSVAADLTQEEMPPTTTLPPTTLVSTTPPSNTTAAQIPPEPPPAVTTGFDLPDLPLPVNSGPPLTHEEVFGGPTVDSCSAASDCLPLDACTDGGCGASSSWTGKLTDGLDSGFQEIGAETIRVRIEITPQQASVPPRRDVNPLGLLSRSVSEFVNWWMPTVYAAEQSLQKGLQFLITSQGGSTGKNLTMQVLNFTGKPVNLQGMLALEPLKKDAQQKVTQAFSKLAGRQLPSKVDLNAYCLEFLKLPPMAGQVMRVAGPEVQKRFAPMKRIMAAANKLTADGALKPDSNPASYADSIKQWALWTVEQKFTDKKFAEAFFGHTRKNVEAAGQKWTKQIEDVVRQRTPNRWQDIVQILKAAGASVPE